MNTDDNNIPACFSQTFHHANFSAALERLVQITLMKTSTRLVFVTGPTGIGKTTMLHLYAERLATLAAQEMETDPEMLPYGAISVKAPGSAAYSWKDTYLQQLRALQHPFADSASFEKKPYTKIAAAQKHRILSPEQAHRLPQDRLFRILQNAIRHRKPKAIILDEAHHLLRVGSTTTLINQLEHLKYIADETATLHVLFGTYELIKLADLSPALIRRREVVHVPRYIFQNQKPTESLKDFAGAAAHYANGLDAHCKVDLLQEIPYLYQGCVGCVGILRDWLYRAYQLAKVDSEKKIEMKHLKQTVLASSDLKEILDEALSGEYYFTKRSLCEHAYLSQLGFVSAPAANAENPPKVTKQRRSVGKRAPHRDAAGPKTLDAENQDKAA